MGRQSAASTRQGAQRPSQSANSLFSMGQLATRQLSVQRQATGSAVQSNAAAAVRGTVEQPGRPLDAETRSVMEPKLGYNLSSVRVHTDANAAASAQAVRANAYTAGSHIAFDTGRYTPGTLAGQRLMAHELTHVVQQSQGPVAGTSIGDDVQISHPSDKFEREASVNGNSLESSAGTSLPRHLLAGFGGTRGENEISVQRDNSASDVISASGSATSGVASLIGLYYAKKSADASVRQADAADKGLDYAKSQADSAKEGLIYAKQQADAAQNPPIPPPTTGGIVVNNGNPYSDIPSSEGTSKKGEDISQSVGLLKVSQGSNNFANFGARVKLNGSSIKGGSIEDGEAKGYTGGSGSSNLSLSLRPTAGDSKPANPKSKSGSTIASTRFLISGTNVPPRGSQIQRFSGSVSVNAAGLVTPEQTFNVSPGSPKEGKGTPESPAWTVDLPGAAVPGTVTEDKNQAPRKSAPAATSGTPSGGPPK